MAAKNFWIKQRHNPQTGTYYVPMGQLTKAEAKKHENTLYGDNTMLRFSSEEAYKSKIESLKSVGARVR